MTKRIVNVKKIQAKAHGPLTPHAQEVLNKIKEEASQLNVLMVDAVQYQVNSSRSQCVVNMKNRTCTCRKWDLTSMPCKHAVAAINDMARNDIRIGVPEELVDEVYWLSTWKKVYENVINPIPGPENWIPSQCPTKLLPPKHHKQVGRPQKKRKKSVGKAEVEAHFDSEGKMTRKGNTTKCSKCGNLGHNSRTCKGQGGENVENVVHAPSENQVAGGENKTRKKCSKCGSLGHNSRTCKGQGGENVQESQTVSQGAPSESEA
ncbi:putative transcription factor interactor and regulator CCHC(Zn) family [Helianthus annuus]|nr:putative transcription factor interactor and regulator CCHC(Zn) family [Helianthus annuus]